MGRSLKQIKTELTTPFMANEQLAIDYGFVPGASFDSEFSLVSLENILFEIVALAHFVHEQFFGQHTKEIDERLANEKPGGLAWYRTMALRFQYGYQLVADRDYYDNSNLTAEAVSNSKIIKYAAVNEATDSSRVILKIAGETDGVLSNFTDDDQIQAIENYVKEFRIAGVQVTIINYRADRLFLNLEIKRNAQLIDANGLNIATGTYPVIEALEEFMKELDFNGELRLSALIDKLQIINGVLDATVLSAQSSWISPELADYGTPQPIYISKVAESGYFEIQSFETIRYVV